MFKVCGNLYGQTKVDFEEMRQVLEASGYQVAYQSEIGGVVIKEMPDIEGDANEQ